MSKGASDLDAYLAALDHPRRSEVIALVALILESAPGLTGQVKWNAPSFGRAGDDRVTLRLHPPPALQIVFHRGARAKPEDGFSFDDPSGMVEWLAPDRGIVKLGEGELAEKGEALRTLIARWIEATA